MGQVGVNQKGCNKNAPIWYNASAKSRHASLKVSVNKAITHTTFFFKKTYFYMYDDTVNMLNI